MSSEHPPQRLKLPIHDDSLARDFNLPLSLMGGRVANFSRLKMKPFKYSSNVRVVVNADHHLALQRRMKSAMRSSLSNEKSTP